MFTDKVQYQIRKPLKVLLITNKERQLPEGVFTDRELNTSMGKKLITTPLDINNNIVMMDKLAYIMAMVLSLDKLDNYLKEERLSNILLRYHVTDSKEFTSFEPVAPQYKILKNGEFASLTLRIMDQKDNGITDGPEMMIVFHNR